jgi:CheY-like chemotaxis protein
MDGIVATKKLRQFEKEQGLAEKPILILTGNSTAEQRARAIKAGANEFLTKPINRRMLGYKLAASIPCANSVFLIDSDAFALEVNRHML